MRLVVRSSRTRGTQADMLSAHFYKMPSKVRRRLVPTAAWHTGTHGPVAQRQRHTAQDGRVGGSNPLRPTGLSSRYSWSDSICSLVGSIWKFCSAALERFAGLRNGYTSKTSIKSMRIWTRNSARILAIRGKRLRQSDCLQNSQRAFDSLYPCFIGGEYDV